MRWAIYFAPHPDSPLSTFGSRWLGRDAASGAELEQLPVPGYTLARVASLTAGPRRYGFHATLKAPFALAPDCSAEQLGNGIAAFARDSAPLPIGRLEVRMLDGFLALQATLPSPALNRFAFACVKVFDRFRASATEDELARRSAGLTPRQQELLARWGYPYVGEEFRFHLTLTNRLDADARRSLLPIVSERYAGLALVDIVLDSICLFAEPAAGEPFRIIERYSLGGFD